MRTTDELIAAEAAIARAETDVQKRDLELAGAIHEEQQAAVAYDTSESDADQKKAALATTKRASKERLVGAATVALKRAQEDAKKIARDRAEHACTSKCSTLGVWTESLRPHVAQLVEIAARASDAVDAIAAIVVAGMDLHADYLAECEALGWRADAEAPTLAAAKRLVREAITAARAANGHEDVSAWLASQILPWQRADLSTPDLAAVERASSAARQYERDQATAFAAASAASIVVANAFARPAELAPTDQVKS